MLHLGTCFKYKRSLRFGSRVAIVVAFKKENKPKSKQLGFTAGLGNLFFKEDKVALLVSLYVQKSRLNDISKAFLPSNAPQQYLNKIT